MQHLEISLPAGKKIHFASDFHLGAPDYEKSRSRESKIVRWLESIETESAAILLVGDIFDFWFEYHHVIPKGFIRFQGKLAQLRDRGIPIYFFHGNHDMWMFDYFQKELDIPVYKDMVQIKCNGKKLLVGHGDGLGPGDATYKRIKKIFRNKIAQRTFQWIHPNLGMALAHSWSRKSRIQNGMKEDVFREDEEWLWQYCREVESKEHHDYYIFGHRHLSLQMNVNENSKYYNLGEWMNQFSFGSFDGEQFELQIFEDLGKPGEI